MEDIFERLRQADLRNQANDNLIKRLKETKVFNVVEDQERAKEIEASARTRGANDLMLTNLAEHYEEWASDESNAEKTYLVPLTGEGTVFGDKKVENVYAAVQQRIVKLELKQTWRLLKHTEGEDEDAVTTLYIAHL